MGDKFIFLIHYVQSGRYIQVLGNNRRRKARRLTKSSESAADLFCGIIACVLAFIFLHKGLIYIANVSIVCVTMRVHSKNSYNVVRDIGRIDTSPLVLRNWDRYSRLALRLRQ